MKKRWAGNREIRNRFAYRLIYGGGKWTDEGRVLTFRITRWRKKGRMRWMQWKLDVNHGNTLTPVLFHYIFISFLFLFPFFFLFFLSSDNSFSSFILNSGIPEFIPEVCWRNNNSDHVAIIIFTVFFLFLLLLFGENVTQSLRRMWIGSGGYVMKTEPRATDKNEAIFSIAYVNPNLQANNF